MRFFVHFGLFKQTMALFGSMDQQRAYKDLIDNWDMIGCFAMTELGHSSNLRGLETTATYHPPTDSFIIHSPTVTSTKVWIGMAGHTATHTLALCQLIIDGQGYGTHWFLVQLRDISSGRLCPGVAAGDMGPKAGRHGLDNGWIQFSHVIIPRHHMLSRFAGVDANGQIQVSNVPANMAYITLVWERMSAVRLTWNVISQASVIAVRYSCVRRQGESADDDGLEMKIMDYQTQQVRLMPVVAFTFMVKAVERYPFLCIDVF